MFRFGPSFIENNPTSTMLYYSRLALSLQKIGYVSAMLK